MSICINTSHPEFIALQRSTGINPAILRAEVALWQQRNNSDQFPSASELMGVKEGVQELFDSNPELANQVYEALGFDNTVQTKGTINVYWGQAESNSSTRILSNLAPRKFNWEGKEYGSVEHAYQSNKSGSFDKATYDAYNKIGGHGSKIRGKGTVAEMKAADSLGLMKKLVVESFKQNPNSEATKKLLQYENFTHNTNELIDKAFLEGLKLAQQELTTATQITPQQKQQALQAYSQYLDTIFPDSKVKDIVYHGTPHGKFDKFNFSNIFTGDRISIGHYFLNNRQKVERYLKGEFKQGTSPTVISAIVNVKNTISQTFAETISEEKSLSIVDKFKKYIDEESYNDIIKEIEKKEIKPNIYGKNTVNSIYQRLFLASNYNTNFIKDFIEETKIDSFFQGKELFINDNAQLVILDADNIHILGSKQDIEGFKRFTERGQTPVFFQEPSLNTVADIENELLRSYGIKRYNEGLMITKNGYVDAVNKVGRVNRQLGYNAVTVHRANKFGEKGREIFYIKIDPRSTLFQQEEGSRPVDTALDNRMLSIMSELGISLVNYEEYRKWYEKKYGKELTASAVADMMRKVIAVKEGSQRYDTLTEEVSHFIVYAMKDDPRIVEALSLIEETNYWKKYSEQYMEAYGNDRKRVRMEIVGKMLTDSMISEFNIDATPKWKTLLKRILNAFIGMFSVGSALKERRIRESLDAISKSVMENPAAIKERIQAGEDQQFFQIDRKMFRNSRMLDGMTKELETALNGLKTRVQAMKIKGTGPYYVKEKELIRAIEKDLTEKDPKLKQGRVTQGIIKFIAHAEDEAEGILNRLDHMRGAFANGMYDDELAQFADVVNDMYKYLHIYRPLVSSLLVETRSDMRTQKRSGAQEADLQHHVALIEALENINSGITQMDNDYSYYSRSIYVYTMKPFLEAYYKDKRMTPEERDAAVERELEELMKITDPSFISADINWYNKELVSLAESPDQLLALTDRLVKDRILAAQRQTYDDMQYLFRLDDELKASGVADTAWMYERDSTGKPTGNLVTRYNMSQYNESKKLFYEELHRRLGLPEDPIERLRIRKRDINIDQEYIESENEWYERNNDLNPDFKNIIADKERRFIEQELKFQKDIDRYYEVRSAHPTTWQTYLIKNDLHIAKGVKRAMNSLNRWKNDRIWEDMNGNVRFRKEFAVPKASIYSNPQFDDIMNSAAKKRYYEGYMDRRSRMNSHMNDTYRNSPLAPQIRKDLVERTLSEGGLKAVKESLVETLTKVEDDTAYGLKHFDVTGKVIKSVPIYYSTRLKDTNDLSLDATSSLVLYANMMNRHRNLTHIQSVIEIGDHVMRSRKVADAGLLSKFASLKGTPESREGGNIYDRYRSYIDMIYYGETKNDRHVPSSKAIDALTKYTAINKLGLNIFAGLSNVTLGNALVREEAFAKQYVTHEDLSKARKAYWQAGREGIAGLMGDSGNLTSSNKLRLFLERFDALQDFESRVSSVNADRGKWGRMFKESSFFLLNHLGEHQMQSRMALALAYNRKLMGPDGNEISLYDALVVENGRLELIDGVKNLDGSEVTDIDMDNFSLKIQAVNQKLHGIYNTNDRSAIQRYALGRAAMLFRKWIPSGINRRFESPYKSYTLNEEIEGMYYTLGARFMTALWNEIKAGQFSLATSKEIYDRMTPMQQANMRRSMIEVGYFLAATVFAGILTGLAGDDDDNWFLNMAAYQAQRFSTDLGIFIPVWNATEITAIVQSPSAALDQLDSILSITKTIDPSAIFSDDDFFKEYKAGRNKGTLKLQVWANRQIPLYETVTDWFYPEERLKYFISL
jgi:hypothetical protein